MEGYEIVVILDAGLDQNDQDAWLERATKAVEKEGGKILRHDCWGRKQLAYPVKKQEHGTYYFLCLEQDSGAKDALERSMRFDETVLKWLTLRVDDIEKSYDQYMDLKNNGSLAEKLSAQ